MSLEMNRHWNRQRGDTSSHSDGRVLLAWLTRGGENILLYVNWDGEIEEARRFCPDLRWRAGRGQGAA